jgi:hypothetical protein
VGRKVGHVNMQQKQTSQGKVARMEEEKEVAVVALAPVRVLPVASGFARSLVQWLRPVSVLLQRESQVSWLEEPLLRVASLAHRVTRSWYPDYPLLGHAFTNILTQSEHINTIIAWRCVTRDVWDKIMYRRDPGPRGMLR